MDLVYRLAADQRSFLIRVKSGLDGQSGVARHCPRGGGYGTRSVPATLEIAANGPSQVWGLASAAMGKPDLRAAALVIGLMLGASGAAILRRLDRLTAPYGGLGSYGRARLSSVTIGQNNGLEAEVLSGLEAGDQIVLHPSDKIRDGMRIRPR